MFLGFRVSILLAASCSLVAVLVVETRSATFIQKEQLTAEQHLEKAREALHEKKYGAAKAEAKRALSLNKEIPEPYLLLAIAARQQGELNSAMGYVSKALERNPDYADAHYILGLLQFQKKNFAGARDEANAAILKGARFSNSYLLLAQAYLAISSHQEAVDALQNALALVSSNDEAARLKLQIEALNDFIRTKANRSDPSYTKPRLLNQPRPRYTDEARTANVQGTVRLAVLVTEDGSASSPIVFVGIGYGLDEEAIRAARSMKFTPATKDGKPVKFWQMVLVEFNLKLSFEVINKNG